MINNVLYGSCFGMNERSPVFTKMFGPLSFVVKLTWDYYSLMGVMNHRPGCPATVVT